MKGTEKLIAHIQADAQAQTDAILAQAEQQCAVIREENQKKADEAYAEKIRTGVKACEDLAESKKRIAEMESKKNILALKQEMVSAGFDRAKNALLSMPEGDYARFLTGLVIKAAPDGKGEILLNSADRAKYGEVVVKAANMKLNGNLTLSEETGSFSGGVIIRNGLIETNSTVESLVDFCRADMSAEVAKLLFG